MPECPNCKIKLTKNYDGSYYCTYCDLEFSAEDVEDEDE